MVMDAVPAKRLLHLLVAGRDIFEIAARYRGNSASTRPGADQRLNCFLRKGDTGSERVRECVAYGEPILESGVAQADRAEISCFGRSRRHTKLFERWLNYRCTDREELH